MTYSPKIGISQIQKFAKSITAGPSISVVCFVSRKTQEWKATQQEFKNSYKSLTLCILCLEAKLLIVADIN